MNSSSKSVYTFISFVSITIFAISSLALAEKEKEKAKAISETTSVSVELKNGEGKSVGTAVLSPLTPDKPNSPGVIVTVDVHGLKPGTHGIHFHENPTCTGPDFKSAGGHFAKNHKEHGFENKAGHHEGDLPNIQVKEDGTAQTKIESKDVTLGKGDLSLTEGKGRSLVIHEKADDYKSQPAGDSGSRIACGEIH